MYLAAREYDLGNYTAAITEARRAAYFNDSLQLRAYLLIADCHIKTESYTEAARHLRLAAGETYDDSLRQALCLRRINMYLKDQQPAYALIELSSLNGMDPALQDRINFYSMLAYFQISDYTMAEQYANRLLRGYPDYDSVAIHRLFTRVMRNSEKSPFLPALSSALLPGSGQLMTGHYREAANTFLLNAALGVITYISFLRLYPLDVVLTFLPYVKRYYLSGIMNARALTVNRKEEKDLWLYNELLDYTDRILHGDDIR